MRNVLCVLSACLLAVALDDGRLAGQPKDKPPAGERTVEAHPSASHGALQVKVDDDKTTHSFDVRQGGKSVKGSPRLLNATLELPPGEYVVAVNKTTRPVTIEAGKKVVLRTGQLKVEGKPPTRAWYALEGDVKLTSSGVEPLLNKAIPLFAGRYAVYVDTSLTGKDQSLGEAEVKVGQVTVLKH